jgi:hypothetical protein
MHSNSRAVGARDVRHISRFQRRKIFSPWGMNYNLSIINSQQAVAQINLFRLS